MVKLYEVTVDKGDVFYDPHILQYFALVFKGKVGQSKVTVMGRRENLERWLGSELYYDLELLSEVKGSIQEVTYEVHED